MKRSPSTGRPARLAAALLPAVVAVSLVGCGKPGPDSGNESTNPATTTSAPVPAPAPARPASDGAAKPLQLTPAELQQEHIRVETLQLAEVDAPLALTGTLRANQDRLTKVVPRLPGRIVSVAVALGAQVQAGQALAVLESIALGEARSAVLQARSEASVTHAERVRTEKLAAEDIVPRKTYLRAKADAERAGAALRAATDKLRMLGMAPTGTGDRPEAVYTLVAPFAGTVIDKQAVPGTFVDKEPLFTLGDLSTLWVVADVFERDLSRVAVGSAATVTVAAYPQDVFPGRLIYLSDVLDEATRTVKTHIEVANPQRRLKPGMFASASIATTTKHQVLSVPTAAVTLIDGKPTVFVATAAGFAPRLVETENEQAGRVTLTQGVAAGDQVVVDGVYALKSRLLKSKLGSND